MKKINTIVEMNDDSIENYGEKYRGVRFRITSRANKYMPASEFFSSRSPEGYHPGYDSGCYPMGLYDLENVKTGEPLDFSLYDWELK